ncbi:hypothetical protein [Paenibacillus bovis]|uniref:Flagellar hook-length control protein-like C-terminal domain-containing protein n=1 Tax=Paenibacillus bovis TaxID=1616788 RepID=A0A172ZH81_9BACL|nr:hypothetical protein [Paenibacillus bovis]ANF96500.1 hypothetical protein AR543_11120 [Paenibacillus bovis]
MNIGSLFRGMMGDVKPGEAKQMELKEGQVVRGVVSSVSDDGQEAVIQIQGVKVRAKLETPLQQGETTMLQVQPPGKDGMPVLKPVAGNQNTPLPAASMGELLESFSLPDTKDNRAMITQMRASGIPLTADNVKNIQTSLAQKPDSVPVGEWVKAAAVAVQKGLPVTGQSVAGLHQALFGPPLHETLGNMLQSIESQLKAGVSPQTSPGSGATAHPAANPNTATSASAPSSAMSDTPVSANANVSTSAATAGQTLNTPANAGNTTTVLLNKIQNVLQQINSLVPQNVEQDIPLQNNVATAQTAPVAQEADTVAQPAMSNQNKSEPAAPGAGSSVPSQSTAAQPKPTSAPWVGQVLKLLGAEYEQQTVRAALTLTAASAGAATEAQGGTAASSGMPANTTAPQPGVDPRQSMPVSTGAPIPSGTASSAAASLSSGNTPVNNQSPIPAVPDLPDAPTAPQPPAINSPSAASIPTSTQHPGPLHVQDRTLLTGDITQPDASQIAQPAIQSAEDTLAKAQDTLKGLLLQLTAADDVPPALKDAAQQMVQQLTGQQLLLNTDRTAPFAQVTMFVPFNGPDGQETASVQIQSRRGAKGELDASNCRLWFDLDMKMLGPTLLDVHVVDKIVTLKVHNDLEQLAPLIESKKQEVADAIGSLGYQLLSLQFAGLPVRSAGDDTGMNSSGLLDQYAPPEYKGVDMKI